MLIVHPLEEIEIQYPHREWHAKACCLAGLLFQAGQHVAPVVETRQCVMDGQEMEGLKRLLPLQILLLAALHQCACVG